MSKSCQQAGVKAVSNCAIQRDMSMSIEFEAADGSRATQTLFEASEIKVVNLVLGRTNVLLTTPEHEEGSKTLNICHCHGLEQQGSAQQLGPAGVAAADSLPSDGPQEPAVMEKMTKEEFVEKLRGWIMVLASLFASMTFQAGINPPKQFQPDTIMEHGAGAQSPTHVVTFRTQLFYVSNTFVFAYSLGLVTMMLFQPSLYVERLISKRGLLCGNIIFLLVVYALGSSDFAWNMILSLFFYFFLVGCVCYKFIWKLQGMLEETESETLMPAPGGVVSCGEVFSTQEQYSILHTAVVLYLCVSASELQCSAFVFCFSMAVLQC